MVLQLFAQIALDKTFILIWDNFQASNIKKVSKPTKEGIKLHNPSAKRKGKTDYLPATLS